MKDEFTLDDSDDPDVSANLTKPTFEMKRVTRVIDVSDGIKKEDAEIFQDNQILLAKQHR